MKCSTKNIILPTLFPVKSSQKEFEFEVTLPDYLPNIEKTVKADVTPVSLNRTLSGEKFELNGELGVALMYISDYKSKAKAYRFNESFDMKADMPGVPDDSIASAEVFCESISCKMLTPRKFLIRCRICMDVCARAGIPASLIDETEENGFYKTEAVSFSVPKSPVESEFSFAESIDLGDGFAPAGEIISSTISCSPCEITAGEGYAAIKTGVSYKCIYESESKDGELIAFTKTLPLSITLDDSTINGECECFGSVSPINAVTTTEINAYGEPKILKLEFSVKASLEMEQPQSLVLATDAFAPGTEAKSESAALEFDTFEASGKKNFTIEKLIETKDVEFTKLYDSSSVIKLISAEASGGETLCEGSASVSLLGEAAGGMEALDFTVNFGERLPADNLSDIKFTPIETSAVIVGGTNISLRIVGVAEYKRFKHISCNALQSCEFAECSAPEKSGYIIYYPAANDTLWTIAKQYGIAPELLRETNSSHFEGEKLTDSSIIVIPKREKII